MYFLYSCVTSVVLVLVSPWLAWQAWRHGKYAHSFAERLGALPAAVNPDRRASLWIHAVSVGEVLAARALIPGLRARYPDLAVLVSTTTRTGREVATRHLEGIEGLFYFPLDFAFSIRRVLARLRPRLVVVVETEIWPRLLRECRLQQVPVMLINARVSDRSFPRYRLARTLVGPVLHDFSLLCAQSDRSADRLRAMGAPADRLVVTGSLKFDALDWSLPDSGDHPVLYLLRGAASRPVLLAASTLRGEDALVLDAFMRLRTAHPDALLILVPRHPERFDEVFALARQRDVRVVRRSALVADAPLAADVVVLDSMGELAAVFGLATVVFVGGSLVDAGGHNILEPALFAKPIVVGPSMSNFAEIAALFRDADALVQVPDGDGLTMAVLDLFATPARRDQLGARARALLEQHRGAGRRTLEAIAQVLPPTPPMLTTETTSAGPVH
jgi:3-deoxy-D-manno-octulosonic-acid transferase